MLGTRPDYVLQAVYCQPKPGGEVSSRYYLLSMSCTGLSAKSNIDQRIKNVNGDSTMPTLCWTPSPSINGFCCNKHKTAPNFRLRKALDYPLKRWSALLRYLDDSHVPIDNNSIEKCLCPVAIGRKNVLFAESLRARQRMAAILNLLETAKLNGYDPSIWLRDVLAAYPPGPTIAPRNYYPTPKTALVNIRQFITLF